MSWTDPRFAITLLLSGAIVLASAPVLARIAHQNGLVDAPDGERKFQRTPIAYLGGVAIALAVTASTLLLEDRTAVTRLGAGTLMGVILPALGLAVVGLVDDLRGLTPGSRFIAQTCAAIITAVAMTVSGTGVKVTGVDAVDIVVTVGWVVVVTNAFNLIDNADGLAAGTAAIAGVIYFAMAVSNGHVDTAFLAIALVGACLAFLRWNWFPARMYMGDAGALFIGFLLAALSIRIQLYDAPRLNALVAPLLVVAIPAVDTTVVVLSRLRRGLSPFVGGRDHLSHRLIAAGLSGRNAVRLLHAGAMLTGLLAIVIAQAKSPIGTLAIVFSGFALIAVTIIALKHRRLATEPW